MGHRRPGYGLFLVDRTGEIVYSIGVLFQKSNLPSPFLVNSRLVNRRKGGGLFCRGIYLRYTSYGLTAAGFRLLLIRLCVKVVFF